MTLSRKRALALIALGIVVLYYLSNVEEKSPASEDVRREKIREWKQRNERRSFREYLSKGEELIQPERKRQVPVETKKDEWNHMTKIEPGVLEKGAFDKHIVLSKDSFSKQMEEQSKGSTEDYVKEVVWEGNDDLTNFAYDEGASTVDREHRNHIAELEEENQRAKVASEFDSKGIADILQDKKIEASYVVLNDWTKFNWEKYNKGCPKNKYRKRLVQLLKAWIKIAMKHDIRYCLTYGSLVGALRNRDIIPHDKDIDIYINGADYKHLVAAAQPRNFDANDGKIHLVLQEDYFEKEMDDRIRKSCQGEVVDSAVDHCAFQEAGARLIRKDRHIDIYPLRLDNAVVEDPVRHVLFKRSHVLPFQSCEFMGLNTFCPNDGKRILAGYYNDKDPLRPLFKCENGEWVEF